MKKPLPISLKKLSGLILLLLCLVLFNWANASFGGQTKPSIVVVLSSDAKPYLQSLQGFKENLSKSGIDHEPMTFDLSEQNRAELLSAIRGMNPDLIHTIGTEATRSFKDSFPEIPLIFSMVLNPVDSGIIGTMKNQAGNISGASLDIPLDVQFSHIRKMFPLAKKIGVIYSEKETGILVNSAERAAREAGFELKKRRVSSAKEVPDALGRIIGDIDVLWSVADSNVFTKETVREILLASIREKVPFIGLSAPFVKAGALAAFESDPAEIGSQAAEATKMALEGRNASGIPVSVPRRIKIILNTNTLDLMGISIPKEVYSHAEKVQPQVTP